MKIKILISSVVIALSSVAANARPTLPVHVSGPSFAEVLLATFTLATASDVNGTLGYVPHVLAAPGLQIASPPVTFSTLSAYNIDSGDTTFATLSGMSFTFSNLAAGPYQLRTNGWVERFNLAGAQFTVTQVPEPETFAMLLAGLGLVGGLVRHQKMAARRETQAV